MTLIEDARRLAQVDPWYENERAGTSFCIACGAYESHRDNCPWLALPRIVQALEAGGRLIALPCSVNGQEPFFATEVGGPLQHWFCGGQGQHKPDCPWQALVVALRGDEVPA